MQTQPLSDMSNSQQVTNQAEEVVFRNPIDEIGWAKLSHLLTEDKVLSDGAYRTYAVLLKFAQQKERLWAGVETLARLRHRNAATISRHLAELQERKLITRKRRLGRSWITVIEDVTKIYVAEIQSHRVARLNLAKIRNEPLQERNVNKNELKEKEEMEKECVPPSAHTHVSSLSENRHNDISSQGELISSTQRKDKAEKIVDRQHIANKILGLVFRVPYSDVEQTNLKGWVSASDRRTADHVATELLADVRNDVLSREDLDEALEQIAGESSYLLDTAMTSLDDMPINKRIFRVADAVSAYWSQRIEYG